MTGWPVCSSMGASGNRSGEDYGISLPAGSPLATTPIGEEIMSEPRNLAIDGDRLWQSLMDMAVIGATEKVAADVLR